MIPMNISCDIISGMKLGEKKKSWNSIFLGMIFVLCALLFTPSFSYSAENKAVDTKTPPAKTLENKVDKNKTPIVKSLVNKLTKNKSAKNKKNADKTNDKTPESEVTTIKGAVTFSMDDCINYAMKHDPNIKIYADTQKAQKSLVGQAKSNYFPRLNAGTGYNINGTNTSGGLYDGYQNNNNYGISAGINQLIWDFGKTTANINMNKYGYEASGYDLSFQIAISTYNVRLAYTAVLAARANESIYALSVRINQLNYERTKAMYEVGLKSKIDVVNAQSNLTQARINLVQAQNQYQTALITLNNSMYFIDAPDYSIKDTETFNFQKDYSVKNEIDVAYDRKNYDDASVNTQIKDGAILTSEIEKRDIIKTYHFKPYTLSMADSIKKAYENRPDLKSMQLLIKVQEESLKVIKRSYYPQINANAAYTYGAYNDYNANTLGIYAGINLPTNLNVMNLKYQIDQGKALLDIAISKADMLKKNIYFQVETDYVTMKQYEKTIPLKSQKVAQSLENFELADGRYAVGLGDYIALQQALTDYNNAQLDFVQAVFSYNQARFNLGKDMGILEGV